MDAQMVALAQACENRLALDRAVLSPEYFYASLPLALLDAVFSIGVRYASTRNVVIRYCSHYELLRIRPHAEFLPPDAQHTVSDMISKIEAVEVEAFADRILFNRQRTSAKNGILKADAVLQCARILQSYGIETMQNFHACGKEELKMDFCAVPGQQSGKSFVYLEMLCGNDNYCKPDRHIVRFVSDALERPVSAEQAAFYLKQACALLQRQHPNLTMRTLYHTIWNAMAAPLKNKAALRR